MVFTGNGDPQRVRLLPSSCS